MPRAGPRPRPRSPSCGTSSVPPPSASPTTGRSTAASAATCSRLPSRPRLAAPTAAAPRPGSGSIRSPAGAGAKSCELVRPLRTDSPSFVGQPRFIYRGLITHVAIAARLAECLRRIARNADVAQLVERRLPKPKVAGSRPVVRFGKGPKTRACVSQTASARKAVFASNGWAVEFVTVQSLRSLARDVNRSQPARKRSIRSSASSSCGRELA